MTFDPAAILAINWPVIFWNVAAVVLFFLGLFLILVILIQDSQGGGLGGSFGGGGGDSMLGARAQRGITKFTAVLGAIFAGMIVVLGAFHPGEGMIRPGDEDTAPALRETGAPVAPEERTALDILEPDAGSDAAVPQGGGGTTAPDAAGAGVEGSEDAGEDG